MAKKDFIQLDIADDTARRIHNLYLKTIRNILRSVKDVPNIIGSPFDINKNPYTKDWIDDELKNLTAESVSVINQATNQQWLKAYETNMAIAKPYLARKLLTPTQQQAYLSRNLDALKAFQKRKIGGLGLSDKVWKYNQQFKGEIEMGLDTALREGTSAQSISRKLRSYLQEPSKLFKKVADEHGVLHLSKMAKKYSPGAGVYRSSYKNAMRLARTEVNMAYRTADNEKYQQFDFVQGFEVKRSNNIYSCDICKELVGIYPKDFRFVGWHPQCRCYTVPILNSEKDFIANQKAILAGEMPKTNWQYRTPNKNFREWYAKNKQKLDAMDKPPYFIRDNKFIISKMKLPPIKTIPKVTKTDKWIKDFNDGKINFHKSWRQVKDDLVEQGHGDIAEAFDEWMQSGNLFRKDTGIKNVNELRSIFDKVVNGGEVHGTVHRGLSIGSFEEMKKFNEFFKSHASSGAGFDLKSLYKDPYGYTDTKALGGFSTSKLKSIANGYATGYDDAHSIVFQIRGANGKPLTGIDMTRLGFQEQEVVLSYKNKYKVFGVEKFVNENGQRSLRVVLEQLPQTKTKTVVEVFTKKGTYKYRFKTVDQIVDKMPTRPEADKLYRIKSGEYWASLPKTKQKAIYRYTSSDYSEIDAYHIGKSSTRHPNSVLLEDALNNSSYDAPHLLKRGAGYGSFGDMVGESRSALMKIIEDGASFDHLVGRECTMRGFSSAGAAVDTGFTKKFMLYLEAPPKTKMMYVEPVSAHGRGAGLSWDGIAKQTGFSSEQEVLLQLNTKVKIIHIDKTYSGLRIYARILE